MIDISTSGWVVAVCMLGLGCGSSTSEHAGAGGSTSSAPAQKTREPEPQDAAPDEAGVGGRDEPAEGGREAVHVSAGARAARADQAGAQAGPSGGTRASQAAGGEGAKASQPSAAGERAAGGCMDGYRKRGDKCVCDMTGTFVMRQKIEAGLAGVPGASAVLAASTGFSIVRGVADPDGQLKLAITSCGQQGPDTCAASSSLLTTEAEAYAQYVPAKVWDKLMPTSITLQLGDALPNTELTTPNIPSLLGMELQDANGAWPSSRMAVEGSADFGGKTENGARWMDVDDDGQPGLTTYMVPPGGIAASDPNGSYSDYPATSPECSMGTAGALKYAYAYPPALDGAKVVRVKRIYGAQRFVLQLRGKLESCDRISGELKGPEGGALRADSMVAGCVVVDQAGEAPCPTSLLAAMASGAAPQGVTYKGSFIMKRVDDDVTCRKARDEQLD